MDEFVLVDQEQAGILSGHIKQPWSTLYSYNVLDNTVDADGWPLVVGRHKKVSEMSSSLQKRLLDNGISHKELDEFLEHDKEVLNGCRGFTSYASPSSPLDS